MIGFLVLTLFSAVMFVRSLGTEPEWALLSLMGIMFFLIFKYETIRQKHNSKA